MNNYCQFIIKLLKLIPMNAGKDEKMNLKKETKMKSACSLS